jgi:transposase
VEHIGIDVHKNQSQICILTPEGELIEKRIVTDRGRYAAVFGSRPRTRILIEASTESEWVARCLEALGHEVIVADPNYAPMYGHRSRRVKTDRRDARALAEACRNGIYRPAHRTSDGRRHLRGRLAVREALVRTRARYISLIRTLLRREGLRVRSGNVDQFIERLAEVDVPALMRREMEPLLRVLDHLDTQIALADRQMKALASEDEEIRRLCTVPGVGPVTATSVVATLDTAGRFRGAHQVEAYLGLVPREMSSGERQRKGRITKSGNNRARWVLVEAAWVLLVRVKQTRAQPLQAWAQRIAARRGKKVAVVALARRLAGILYAMMRDGTEFDAGRFVSTADRASATV